MTSKQKPAVEWKKRITLEYKRLLQAKRLKRTVAVKVAWSTNLKKLNGLYDRIFVYIIDESINMKLFDDRTKNWIKTEDEKDLITF